MNRENPNVLNEFLEYLASMNYALTTIKLYEVNLMDFFIFIKLNKKIKTSVKNFSKLIFLNLKDSDIISYLIFLNYNKNNSSATRHHKLASIKQFYKWLLKDIPNIENPAENLNITVKSVKLPKNLTLNQAKQIQNIFNSENSKYPLRNNTIIQLFLSTGIRASELVNINIEDIYFNNNCILIKRGKGNKTRNVYFSNSCKKQLLKYLNSKGKIIDVKSPLFSRYHYKHDERMTTNAIRAICKNAYKLIGVENKHFSPHTLRHTSATIMYKYVKKDILLVKEFLGHESVVSTEIYTHLDNDIIQKAVESNPLSNFMTADEKIA